MNRLLVHSRACRALSKRVRLNVQRTTRTRDFHKGQTICYRHSGELKNTGQQGTAASPKPTNTQEWEHLLGSLYKNENYEGVLKAMKDLQDSNATPNSNILSTVLRAFNAHMKNQVAKKKIRGTLWTYPLRRSLGGLQAFAYYAEHAKHNIQPSETAVVALLTDCIARRSMLGVEDLFTQWSTHLGNSKQATSLTKVWDKFIKLCKLCRQPNIVQQIVNSASFTNFTKQQQLEACEALCSLPNRPNLDLAQRLLMAYKVWDETFNSALLHFLDAALMSNSYTHIEWITSILREKGKLQLVDSGTILRIQEAFVRAGSNNFQLVSDLYSVVRDTQRDTLSHAQAFAVYLFQQGKYKEGIIHIGNNMEEVIPATTDLLASLFVRDFKQKSWSEPKIEKLRSMYSELQKHHEAELAKYYEQKGEIYETELMRRYTLGVLEEAELKREREEEEAREQERAHAREEARARSRANARARAEEEERGGLRDKLPSKEDAEEDDDDDDDEFESEAEEAQQHQLQVEEEQKEEPVVVPEPDPFAGIQAPKTFTLPTINIFLTAFAKHGTLAETYKVFESIESKHHLEADIQSFNALLHCCGRFGEAQYAVSVYKILLDRGLQPDPTTLDGLFRSLASDKLTPRQSFDYLVNFTGNKHLVPQDVRTYIYIVDYFLKKKLVVEAMQAVELGIKFANSSLDAFTSVFNAHASLLSTFDGEIPSISKHYTQLIQAFNESTVSQVKSFLIKNFGKQAELLLENPVRMRAVEKQMETIKKLRPIVDYNNDPDEDYGKESLMRDIYNMPHSKDEAVEQLIAKFLPTTIKGDEGWDNVYSAEKLTKALLERILTEPRPWTTDRQWRVPMDRVNHCEYQYSQETQSYVPRDFSQPHELSVADFQECSDAEIEFAEEYEQADKFSKAEFADTMRGIHAKLDKELPQNISKAKYEKRLRAELTKTAQERITKQVETHNKYMEMQEKQNEIDERQRQSRNL